MSCYKIHDEKSTWHSAGIPDTTCSVGKICEARVEPFTYSFDFDAEVLEFALQPVLDLLHAGRLGLGGLQLCLELDDLGVHLALELLHLLGAHRALATLGLVPPRRHLVVGLGQQALQVAATLLLLFQLFTQLVQVRLQTRTTTVQQVFPSGLAKSVE